MIEIDVTIEYLDNDLKGLCFYTLSELSKDLMSRLGVNFKCSCLIIYKDSDKIKHRVCYNLYQLFVFCSDIEEYAYIELIEIK